MHMVMHHNIPEHGLVHIYYAVSDWNVNVDFHAFVSSSANDKQRCLAASVSLSLSSLPFQQPQPYILHTRYDNSDVCPGNLYNCFSYLNKYSSYAYSRFSLFFVSYISEIVVVSTLSPTILTSALASSPQSTVIVNLGCSLPCNFCGMSICLFANS